MYVLITRVMGNLYFCSNASIFVHFRYDTILWLFILITAQKKKKKKKKQFESHVISAKIIKLKNNIPSFKNNIWGI